MVKAQDIKAGFTNQWYVVLTDARLTTDGLKKTVVEFKVRYRDGGQETRFFPFDAEVPGEQGAKVNRLRNDDGEPLMTAAEMRREDELDAEAAFYDAQDREDDE